MTTKQNLLPIGSFVRYNHEESQTNYGIVVGHYNQSGFDFNRVKWFPHKRPFPDGGYYTSSLVLISQVTTMYQEVYPIGTLVKHRYSLDDYDSYGIVVGHDECLSVNLIKWFNDKSTNYLYNNALIPIIENND